MSGEPLGDNAGCGAIDELPEEGAEGAGGGVSNEESPKRNFSDNCEQLVFQKPTF